MSEVNEQEETNSAAKHEQQRVDPNAERAKLIKMFKQIDQAPLIRLGVPKSEISEHSIT